MSAHSTAQQLDLDVQDVAAGDWDELVAEIMRNTGDTTPQDPDSFTISGCCNCNSCIFCGSCEGGC